MPANKKWQNLIHRKCPVCDTRLNLSKEGSKLIYFCPAEGCEFTISAAKLASILTDENHIMRRFATPHELKTLEAAIGSTMKKLGI